MINLSACNEWQHRDPVTGLVFPWYTKSFLDELVTWDLKEKQVFEYGCGASTLWWSLRCKSVRGVETNIEYAAAIWEATQFKIRVAQLDQKDEFIKHIHVIGNNSDIIVVDCDPVDWRDECIRTSHQILRPGGIIIVDNWDQASVWIPSDDTRQILLSYDCKIYKQSGHPDWQTAVFTKP